MTIVRRLCWLLMFAFWQGGFMFYGAIVVPVGSAVISSEQLQGFVTRSVTNYLNLAGAVALGVWCWDLACSKDSIPIRFKLRMTLLLALWFLLGILAWLHHHMDQCLDVETQQVINRPVFYSLHSMYLIISTFQWTLALIFAAFTLSAWHSQRDQH